MNYSILAKAYTEVLAIISYLPKEEYSKIPIKKIELFIKKSDKNYKFNINSKIGLDKQKISKDACTILITLFRDYFSTDKQKEVLENLLQQNQKKLDAENRKKYNPEDIFKKHNQENIMENQISIIEYKEPLFKRFISKIKSIFHII